MKHRIVPAVMSGGAGTRLWPLSTEAEPKQFHALAGADTLFVQTLRRMHGQTDALSFAQPVVLSNASHLGRVRSQLAAAEVAPAAIVCEPMGRNTAAVGVCAAAIGAELDPDALVLLAPADHVIADVAAFHAALAQAAPFAGQHIVTLGIAPNRPATGYGYIKRGKNLGENVYAVDAFEEKPDAETARAYLAAGAYFWNAGIFLFRPEILLAEYGAASEIRDLALASLAAARRVGEAIHPEPALFEQIPSLPLDIAVMEKTARAAVVPCDVGWADVGSWNEVWRIAPRDTDGYALLGPAAAADVAKMRASGVKAAAIDGEDLVVVASPAGLLIAPRALASDRSELDRLDALLRL